MIPQYNQTFCPPPPTYGMYGRRVQVAFAPKVVISSECCTRCGVYHEANKLIDGVCEDCREEITCKNIEEYATWFILLMLIVLLAFGTFPFNLISLVGFIGLYLYHKNIKIN